MLDDKTPKNTLLLLAYFAPCFYLACSVAGFANEPKNPLAMTPAPFDTLFMPKQCRHLTNTDLVDFSSHLNIDTKAAQPPNHLNPLHFRSTHERIQSRVGYTEKGIAIQVGSQQKIEIEKEGVAIHTTF